MRSAAAVFAIAFLMTSTVFSQVHIRESATITPGQTKKMQAGVDHTIRFEFY